MLVNPIRIVRSFSWSLVSAPSLTVLRCSPVRNRGCLLAMTLRATTPAGIGAPPYLGSLDAYRGLFRSAPDPQHQPEHTGADMADQVTTGRFVGRTQQLARLRELLVRATDGEALLVLLGGEAGVGKTRLVEQLAATATQQDVRVLRGGCVPLGEEGLPFAPVTEALRGLADQLDPAELMAVTGSARPELGRLLPNLAVDGVAGATVEIAAGA